MIMNFLSKCANELQKEKVKLELRKLIKPLVDLFIIIFFDVPIFFKPNESKCFSWILSLPIVLLIFVTLTVLFVIALFFICFLFKI